MMKRIRTKRHLKYPSIEAWMEGERISSLVVLDDPKRQNELFEQMGELRQKLWLGHLATLTDDERRMIEEGRHPSQSHSRSEAAREVLNQFKQHYDALPYIGEITLGMYHMDRIVFSVTFNQKIPWQQWQKDIPLFFKGFQIMAGFPEKWEPISRSTELAKQPKGDRDRDAPCGAPLPHH